MARTRRPLRVLVRESVLTAAAAAGVVCLLAAVASFAFDVRPLIFRSGSMGPDIPTGSLALARTVPAAALQPGDVVSVVNPRGTRITHRVVALTPAGPAASLTLKGDANTAADPEPYTVSHADRVFTHVARLGYLVSALSSPYAVFAGGTIFGVLLAGAFIRPPGPGRDATRPGPATHPAGPAGQPRSRKGRQPGGVLVVLVVLAAGVCSPEPVGTAAAFTNAGTATTGTLSTIPYFTCDAAVTAAAPRIYYKLNETGILTAAADASGNARNGVYQGTVTKGVARACTRDTGTAVTLNGSTGYINHGAAITIPTAYSAELWFNTTTTRGGLLLGWGASATGVSATVDRVLYMTNTGGIIFGTNNTAKTTISSAGPYNNGQWHHVMATVGTAGMRLYLDGTQVASSAATATATYNGYFRVGYDNLTGWTSAPTSNFFAGTVDEAAIYNKTLTAADAQQHHWAGT